ncbi:helix-turn-helix transcriptional regulator [Listeria seeligeri]|uniref:helix-turn-helix domain-containing protein n=1 Tax=Listeria seeligeri TaxID=1640 RepID=UPI0016238E49|nr:helix-turn-helix transcriptional regulator [Listeria seeligeri]MBC2069888.1 helix-turn-helix transcriptional regulator [Listeria seeligeri]MBC2087850.1 helix-turn-helix transcriptional regulator [Listeria seeligeri]MBF2400544.1 helix-turn-helix transcriptional regulator [Listeria seeligeri]MBF2499591.1 helix-turn-helix transcriptional regulator [Listeria seeligeri]MBF2651841.1 helix-turn-helix transcriptional regulator [Listeria seeligeri]
MTTFDRVKKLADEQKISLKDLALKLNMGENSIYRWKDKVPTTENIQKVADYFNVTTDYLLNRTDIRNHNSDESQELLQGHPEILAYLQKNTSDEDAMRLLKAFIEFQESQKRTK